MIGHNTIAAAMAFMPFGSGLGTFVPVYQMFESLGDLIQNAYANHAHDDILELWLETGIIGPVLLCVFLFWWGLRHLKWWRHPSHHVGALDVTIARGASVAIALLIANSFLDYPMRTAAIMAVFALCCALLVEPLRADDQEPLLAGAHRHRMREQQQHRCRRWS